MTYFSSTTNVNFRNQQANWYFSVVAEKVVVDCKKPCTLSTQCICGVPAILTANTHHFPKQH